MLELLDFCQSHTWKLAHNWRTWLPSLEWYAHNWYHCLWTVHGNLQFSIYILILGLYHCTLCYGDFEPACHVIPPWSLLQGSVQWRKTVGKSWMTNLQQYLQPFQWSNGSAWPTQPHIDSRSATITTITTMHRLYVSHDDDKLHRGQWKTNKVIQIEDWRAASWHQEILNYY